MKIGLKLNIFLQNFGTVPLGRKGLHSRFFYPLSTDVSVQIISTIYSFDTSFARPT